MNFSNDERKLLASLVDCLIPAAENMPSASDAGVAGKWLDAVLAARPDLTDGLRALLGAAADQSPENVVASLRENNLPAFGVLAESAAGGYFMNPDVQAAIAYGGQSPRPIDPHPDYLDDGLLESVIRRGPIYRPTPSSTR